MRAFVAVDITEPEILEGISRLQSELAPRLSSSSSSSSSPSKNSSNIKLVDVNNLHLTLQFLGEIPDDAQGPVTDALSAVRFDAFDLEIRGVGAFPNTRSPRTVWVGAEEPAASGGEGAHGTAAVAAAAAAATATTGPLPALAQEVADALGPLGYARDGQFRPHGTIFRVKRTDGTVDIAGELKKRAKISFGVQKVGSFKLKRSRLTPSGPVYTDLAVIEASTK